MFRRPVAVAAVIFAAGIMTAKLSNNAISVAIMAVSAITAVGLLFYLGIKCKILEAIKYIVRKNTSDLEIKDKIIYKRIIIFIVIFFTAGFIMGFHSLHKSSVYSDYDGKSISIMGVVNSVKIKDDEKCKITVLTEEGERVLIQVKGYSKDVTDLTGAEIRVRGNMKIPEKADFHRGFDYNLYLRSQKVYMVMTANASTIRILKKPEGIRALHNYIAVRKYDYEKHIFESMNEKTAGAFCGILFGETEFMQEDMLKSFRMNGIGHLLAASGLHVGFLYGLMLVILRRPNNLSGNIPIISVMLVYAVLVGFSASVMRAVFMVMVHIVAQLSHRRYDFLSCIAFCFVILLIWEPTNLFSSGFQLTFIAVFTLAVIYGRLVSVADRIRHRDRDDLCEKRSFLSMGISRLRHDFIGIVGIQIGMMPVNVWIFHYVSPAVLLLNIPAIIIAGFIVPLGIVMMPIYFCMELPFIGIIASYMFEFMGKMAEMLLTGMNDMADKSVLSYKFAASPPLYVILLYYFCVFFFCSELWTRLSDFLSKIHNKLTRSEERRVGKECRSRWSPYH